MAAGRMLPQGIEQARENTAETEPGLSGGPYVANQADDLIRILVTQVLKEQGIAETEAADILEGLLLSDRIDSLDTA